MRICSGPGCLAKVPDDVRLCAECRGDRHVHKPPTSMERNDPYQLQYISGRWKRLRHTVIQAYPVCAECKREPSRVADHNIPAKTIVAICRAEGLFPFDPWGGFYIRANLRGYCHGCHNVKTKTEDGRDWTEELDKILAPYRQRKGQGSPI